MDDKRTILWADDEIDMLGAHVLFLRERGYDVRSVTNGEDAIACVEQEHFDLVLLDEMMPGKDGLMTLAEIKKARPEIPVIMITKNEQEGLMDSALGARIDDFLTKPVNPSQILSACKRILDRKRITEARLASDYLKEFHEISELLATAMTPDQWIEVHLRLNDWELELDRHPDTGLEEMLRDQRRECNMAFGRFVEQEYPHWVAGTQAPILSSHLVERFLVPELNRGRRVVFMVFDCLRSDQWMALEPYLRDYFDIDRHHYYSVLPTATPYARNAMFSGLFPAQLQERYSDLWSKGEEDDGSRNRYEHQLLDEQLERLRVHLSGETRYIKILDPDEARYTEKKLESYFKFPLISIVVNFVDILAHKRSEHQVLKEIIPNEAAYRTLISAWFERSPILQILKRLAAEDFVVFLTSDHGSIRTLRPAKVIGDRETSTGLRYKVGRNLKGDAKQVLTVKDPARFQLPRRGINTAYLIAKEDFYLIYPTHYNKYVNLYKDSFQHGGISLEEMILPFVRLEGKAG